MTGYMHKNGHIKCMAVHTHGTEKACDCVMPSTVFLYVNVLRGEGGQPAFQPSIILLLSLSLPALAKTPNTERFCKNVNVRPTS